MANLDALVETLTPVMKTRTTDQWLEALEAAGIPAGPVLSITEMHSHPQTLARNMVPSVEHPVAGQVQTIGLPVKFSETPGGVKHAAPLLGQHTSEVLQELGYSSDEIANLADRGIAGEPGNK